MRYYKNIKKFVKDKQVSCGMDVHKNHWTICFFCDGEVVEKIKLPANYTKFVFLLQSYSTARQLKIVYEAGFSGFWLYHRLAKDGYSCCVTPPNRVPTSSSKVKTDNRDAESLAMYLSAGLLKSVSVPPVHDEADRRIARRRAQLVKKQTRAKNHIRSFLYLQGIEAPVDIKSKWSNQYLLWLENIKLEYESDTFTLSGLLASYRHIRKEVLEVTRFLRTLSRSPKYTVNFKHITALRGVGLITAMTFLLEIFNFKRFKNAEHFSSYLGLTPSQYSSGDHVRLGHITRQGNAHVRKVLVESAWTVIRHDPHLRAKYDRLKAQGTNGKKAIVAVARCLAVRLRRCILDNTDYVIGVC